MNSPEWVCDCGKVTYSKEAAEKHSKECYVNSEYQRYKEDCEKHGQVVERCE